MLNPSIGTDTYEDRSFADYDSNAVEVFVDDDARIVILFLICWKG